MNALSKLIPNSLRAKLVLFFMTILLWLALANSLLIYLFVSYVREYNTIMETITLTNSINGELKEKLDSEMIDVVYGKVSFNSGSQYDLLNEMNRNLDQIESADKKGLFSSKIVNVRKSLTTTKEYIDRLGEEIKYNRPADVRAITYEYITIATDLVDEETRKLLHETLQYSENSKKNIVEKIKRDIIIFSILFSIAILISFLFAWYISGNIVKPIHLLRNKTNEIAKGNFTVESIDIKSKNEIGDLYRLSNQMFTSLKAIILNARETINVVSASTKAIFKSIQKNRVAAEKVVNEIQTIAGALGHQDELVRQTFASYADFANRYKETVNEGKKMHYYTNQSLYLVDQGSLELIKLKDQLTNVYSLLEEVVKEIDSLSRAFTKIDSNYVVDAKVTNYKIQTISAQINTIKSKINDDYQIVQLSKILESMNVVNTNVQTKFNTLIQDMLFTDSQIDIYGENIKMMEENSKGLHSNLIGVAAMEQLVSLEEVSEASSKLVEQIKKLESMISKFKV